MLKRDGETDEDICPEPYTDMTKDWCTGGLASDAKFKTYVESLETGPSPGMTPAYNGVIEFHREETMTNTPTECYIIGEDTVAMKIRWNEDTGPNSIPNQAYAKVCYAECPS